MKTTGLPALLAAALLVVGHAQEKLSSTENLPPSGLLVAVDVDDAAYLAALPESGVRLVQALLRDPKKVEPLREALRKKTAYGDVTVRLWDGKTLPYADNLVNVIVAAEESDIPRAEVERVLAPGGELGVFDPNSKNRKTRLRKPWPDTMDHWTHHYAQTGKLWDGSVYD